MLLWLVLGRCGRAAVWWIISVVLCVIFTSLLKLSFYGCPGVLELNNPSGHASVSTLVYGAILLVTVTESHNGLQRALLIGGSVGLIVGIAVSRLALHAHSVSEVALGIGIGALTLALFARSCLQCRKEHMSLTPLYLAGGALILPMYGRRILNADALLSHMAGYFQHYCS
jgi:membrane-associated phospholipid phosphatase